MSTRRRFFPGPDNTERVSGDIEREGGHGEEGSGDEHAHGDGGRDEGAEVGGDISISTSAVDRRGCGSVVWGTE